MYVCMYVCIDMYKCIYNYNTFPLFQITQPAGCIVLTNKKQAQISVIQPPTEGAASSSPRDERMLLPMQPVG